jgi:hypothetical protein
MPRFRRNTEAMGVLLTCALAALCGACLAQGTREWSPDLVRSPEAWTDRMNEAVVSGDRGGLRVQIAPGKEWAIAAAPSMLLPPTVSGIRIKVREIGGGRWLMRLYGDLRGTGPTTVGPFQSDTRTGVVTMDLDPRAMRLKGRPPVQVQLGLEGKAGDFVVFEALEFVPGPQQGASTAIPGQREIDCVDMMPNIPQPFKMRDWRAVARGYDRLAFDFDTTGQYLPLIWLDDSRINIDGPTFGIYSYVGDKRQGGSNHEGVTCLGAVLGATLAGIDKSRQQYDYVAMCEAYYNKRNGQNLVLNAMDQGTGGSFWYEIWPHVVFYALSDLYPGRKNMEAIVRTTADRWRDACRDMRGKDGTPDFDHTAFDFAKMQPVDNGQWKEPDAAAGIGWLEYTAWQKFHDPGHLEAADWCMRFLQERRSNPYYECLMPWGALTAARMNAELGRQYDVDKFINWCFGISDCRGGWGVTVGKWGGYDCSGLLGSVDNRGGYAFAMNTFTQAGALVPLVRYDPRYARAIGKWMLNLANSARLFYPTELPADHQSCASWKGDPNGVIAYEGLRHEWNGKEPYATGDPVVMKWGPETDLGLYGSSYVGFLGGIIHPTSDEKILALDCLATDFYRSRAYPTYLVYNPHPESRKVTLDTDAKGRYDVYDGATGRFLARNLAGKPVVSIPGDRAIVAVLTPAGGKATTQEGRMLVDGVVIDYMSGRHQ